VGTPYSHEPHWLGHRHPRDLDHCQPGGFGISGADTGTNTFAADTSTNFGTNTVATDTSTNFGTNTFAADTGTNFGTNTFAPDPGTNFGTYTFAADTSTNFGTNAFAADIGTNFGTDTFAADTGTNFGTDTFAADTCIRGIASGTCNGSSISEPRIFVTQCPFAAIRGVRHGRPSPHQHVRRAL
jgi:hypothetical protein